MKKATAAIVIFVLSLVPIHALGEEEDYSRMAGYVDLSSLEGFKRGDKSVEVYIRKPLLSLVSAMSSEEDPALSNLIGNLALIRVEVFEVDPGEVNQIEQLIGRISKKMSSEKWEKLVRARDREERVEIFLRSDNDTISGLMIVAMDGLEASFINIVGEIDLNLLGKLGAKFNLPALAMDAIPEPKRRRHEGAEDERY